MVDYEVSVQVDEDAVEIPGSWEFMPPADDLPEFRTSVAEDFEDVAPGSAVNPTITARSPRRPGRLLTGIPLRAFRCL